MQNTFEVAVIGGGITGLASALTLSQSGLSVALISPEQNNITQENFDSRIYALSPSNVQLLKNLRIWDSMDLSRVCPISDMRIMGDETHNTRYQGVLNFNAYSAHQTELAWMVEQNNVQKSLYQAIQFAPNITLFNTSAHSLNINENQVKITTKSDQTINAELLIGCDGAQSWTRSALSIDKDIFDYEQSGVITNFTSTLAHKNCAHQWFFSDGSILALLPLPKQQVSMVYSCATNTASKLLVLSSEALSKHISELSHHILGDLIANTSAQAFPLRRMKAHHFISQRAILLGDAAHTIHPLSGQGLNLGLQDIACLQKLITQRKPHQAIYDPRLLRQYERQRLTETTKMQAVTHTLNRTFSSTLPLIRPLRNLGMNLLDITPPLKRWLINNSL